jgi:hypothetical protein
MQDWLPLARLKCLNRLEIRGGLIVDDWSVDRWVVGDWVIDGWMVDDWIVDDWSVDIDDLDSLLGT